MDCSPPGPSVHGISQARILEWVAISYSRSPSPPRDWTCISWISCIVRQILYCWATWEAPPLNIQFSSVQSLSRVRLCDPMDCSMPRFPVLQHLRVCSNSCPLSQWCYRTMSSSVAPFSCLQSFSASDCFPKSQLLGSGSQSIGASASASVLSMNIQGWFPLGSPGLISLLSKRLWRVFSSTTIQKHHFFGV